MPHDSVWYAEADVVEQFLSMEDDYWSLRIWLEKDSDVCWPSKTDKSIKLMLLRSISAIDDAINKQLNAILHHDHFQKLEASWRGLEYLTSQLAEFGNEQNCKIKVLNLSWKELSRDINRAIEFDQSELFRLVYTNEFNMPGGEPFGLLIGDYQFCHKPGRGNPFSDIDTLKGVCLTAAAAFAPFVLAAEPALFGVNHYSELAYVSDIAAQFAQDEYVGWRSLRAMEDARFLGVVIPNMLMRAPYEPDGSRKEAFYFDEQITDPQVDHLWGNAAYGFAAVALKAFTESGWFAQIRGLQPGQYKRGLVFNLASTAYQVSKRVRLGKPSLDLQIGDRLEKQLSDSGFIPLSPVPHTHDLAFFSNASVNHPKEYGSLGANVNAKLSSMLQYTLCASRFAHYIKVMGRDKVGTYETAESIEREFQQWLFSYTTASDEASDEVRSKYPLNEARIKVKEKSGQPGHYYSIIHLRPHFQLDQMVSTIRLITELSPRQANVG
ncbi:type VI secretion system contractile sheath large subunit [Photobacterium lutimaris]|uniref:Type VI secretion system contractile sheath large subunit n=2 Tax=Photobacterium lutimaris TaxID=388278 RepID=A0A2T3J0C6_9GAMM|nr:type VI secretion system contractile sheath large subunit [Photobacterium lutimaris]